jgi:hypothetical protein
MPRLRLIVFAPDLCAEAFPIKASDKPDLVQLATDQQEARYEGDPWEEVIGPWLEYTESASVSEILQKCINKPQAQWTQTDKLRAARCLRAQGWARYRERQGNRLEWRYRKVE